MNAKINTTIKIEVAGQELTLTKDQAMELLSILQKELTILAPNNIREPIPSYPERFYKGDRFDPVNPFPDKNVIWCNRPSSIC